MFAAKNFFLSGAAAYFVANSLRFGASNSANLTRTFSTPTSSTIWTFSTLVKRGSLGAARHLFGASTTTFFGFNSSDQLTLSLNGSTAFTSTAVFRDPTAWMHVVYQQNGAAQTCWVNNVSVASGTTAASIFNTAIVHTLGASNATNFFDGLMSNVTFVDGQALTPSSFGETNATSGQWVPKAYTGTYGTNGFLLEFKDAASTVTIGNSTTGSNNWTTSGISVTAGVTFDQFTDVPTSYADGSNGRGNYPTLSFIDKDSNFTLSDANLAAANADTSTYHGARATMYFPTTGKWYWEATLTVAAYAVLLGLFDQTANMTNQTLGLRRCILLGALGASSIWTDGTNTAWAGAPTFAINDVCMIAYDADNGTLWFGRNGTWINTSGTANPATNTDPRFSSIAVTTTWNPGLQEYYTPSGVAMNYGQRAFAYTPPSGFIALNTQNLSTPAISNGAAQFQATLRTGTGATASVTSLSFQPDLVWIKGRSGATDHGLYDSSRGVQAQLESNTTTAETTETTGLTAFSSSGYTVGALAQLNTNTATYVDWSWKEGVTPGFDIVTYTGNGGTQTPSHVLGATPHFIIAKSRTSAQRWTVFHRSQSAAYGYLNETFAFETTNAINRWGNNTVVVQPTSSVFTVGNNADVNQNTTTYVAYLWTSIPGFSLFSSYTGNGSADGPVVWCGFKPRFVMFKGATGTDGWATFDSMRSSSGGNNPVNSPLIPNQNAVEQAGLYPIDFLASGFKLRDTNTTWNGSGTTYIFAAFAEAPFKLATAR